MPHKPHSLMNVFNKRLLVGLLGAVGVTALGGVATPADAQSEPRGASAVGCHANAIRTTDYADIDMVLRTGKKPIDSLQQFVACLPSEFFEYGNNTSVTDSKSPEADDVSEETPRVILFGKDARTTIAYTGKHDGEFKNQALMIVADPTPPAKNRFISVTFNQGQFPTIQEGDAKCVRCHDGHHIWGSYRNWKGTFGPNTDLEWLREDENGYKSFMNFWRKQAASPYYSRLLANQRGDGGAVTAPSANFYPRNPYAPGSGKFLDKIIPIQARVLQGKMSGNPLYENKKHLLAGTYLGCTIPAPVTADMEGFLKAKFEGSEIWNAYMKAKAGPHYNAQYRDTAIKNLRIFMLSEAMGAPYKSWPLTLATRPKADMLGEDGPAYNTGSGTTLLDQTIRQIRADLMAQHGKYSTMYSAFSGDHWNDIYYSFVDVRYQDRIPGNYPRGFKQECKALETQITDEPSFAAAGVKQTQQKPEQPSTPQEVQSYARRDFQKYCSRCHGPEGNEVELPIHDLKALAQYISTKGEKGIVEQYLREAKMPVKRAKQQPTQEERDRMTAVIRAFKL